jgi:hypothetical protein
MVVRWEEPLPRLRLFLQLTYGQIFEDDIDVILHLGYLFNVHALIIRKSTYANFLLLCGNS